MANDDDIIRQARSRLLQAMWLKTDEFMVGRGYAQWPPTEPTISPSGSDWSFDQLMVEMGAE